MFGLCSGQRKKIDFFCVNLLFDQKRSPKTLKTLPFEFSNCQQVRFVGLEDSSDYKIFRFARKLNFAVVPFDSDFVDLNAMH
jgi:predicted nuclease of predicted toxin-antitoxin system